MIARVEDVPVAHHHPALHFPAERQTDDPVHVRYVMRKNRNLQIPDVVFPQQDLETEVLAVLKRLRPRLLKNPSFLKQVRFAIPLGIGNRVPMPFLDAPGENIFPAH